MLRFFIVGGVILFALCFMFVMLYRIWFKPVVLTNEEREKLKNKLREINSKITNAELEVLIKEEEKKLNKIKKGKK